ncbi:MAG: hypothetical protein R3B49_06885 [Phycisphaerales bacterium]
MAVFDKHAVQIATASRADGLKSDEVLVVLRSELESLGFDVERGKRAEDIIDRPVFFGQNGEPELRYQIDAYHPGWRCGLEVEAGRAWMGNAVYRDLIQAMVMVGVDHLVLAVPTCYRYQSSGKPMQHNAYTSTIAVADAIYSHTRVQMPYGLTVIGY